MGGGLHFELSWAGSAGMGISSQLEAAHGER